MFPSFEIFLSILTDAWMPWLKENRNTDRFEELLSALGPVSECTFADFFRSFAPLVKASRSSVSSKFLEEVDLLSKDCPSHEKGLACKFMELPAADYREQFYNLLIGFSLEGYECRTEQFLKEEQGEEILAFYQTRLLDNIYQLIHVPLWAKNASLQEQALILRVKTALNILFLRFSERRKKQYKGIHWFYKPKEGLLSQLKASGLEENERVQILNLFENITKGNENAPAPPPVHISPVIPEPNLTDNTEQEDEQLKKMAQEWSTDVQALKQSLEWIKNEGNNRAVKDRQEQEKLLGSAEVCKLLNISKSSLQRYRDNGSLPFTKIGGKYLYIPADVKRLIQEGKNRKKTPPRHINTGTYKNK